MPHIFFHFLSFLHINYQFILKFCKKTKNLLSFSNIQISADFFLFSFLFVFGRHSSQSPLHSAALIRADWVWACCIAAVLELPFIPDFSPILYHLPSVYNSLSSSSFFSPLFLHHCILCVKEIFSSVPF